MPRLALARLVLNGFAPLGLMFFFGCATTSQTTNPQHVVLNFPPETFETHGPTGPTFHLAGDKDPSSLATFMYLVPVTSPNAVTVETSQRNSQRIQILPASKRVGESSFDVTAEFEIVGEGYLRNTFDHTQNVQRAEQLLKEGGTLARQLDTITIEGSGTGVIEVEGTISNHLATVTEVRLRFNGRGKQSPVTIGVVDFSMTNGVLHADNEHLARVNTLTFHATTNIVPRMVVSIGAVRKKDAGGGLWQKMTGAFAGLTANIFLKPTRIDPDGQAAMLRFGAHVAAGQSTFTFPQARNLTTKLVIPAKPTTNP